ncbi:MAG: hypothetical protein JNM52_10125, partial [Betaproteobacteria bacterium]|nr:hypothetical protein [Betaproteobacteria bacterium]
MKTMSPTADATERHTQRRTQRYAWVAAQPSLEMRRWAARIEKKRVQPLFIQVNTQAESAQGFMSFQAPPDAEALVELMRALELDAVILCGLDILPIALQAARQVGLAVMICGAGTHENQLLAELLPSHYLHPKQRSLYLALSDMARIEDAKETDMQRKPLAARLRQRFTCRYDAWKALSVTFPDLATTPEMQQLHHLGYRLQTSDDIGAAAPHHYRLRLARAIPCSGLILIPILEFPDTQGEIEVQCRALTSGSTATARVRLEKRVALQPLSLRWPAFTTQIDEELEIQITILNGNRPVRLLEMRRYRVGGVKIDLQPYAHFIA